MIHLNFILFSLFFLNKVYLTLIGRYLHLTDIHYDPKYLTNSFDYLGCHFGNDIQQVGKYGQRFFLCDSPVVLIEDMLSQLQSFVEQKSEIDFIIYTGDSSRHPYNYLDLPPNELTDNVRASISIIQNNFPNIQIIPSIGNNDVSPHDQFESVPNNFNGQNLLNIWSKHIPQDQHQQFQQYGYFFVNITSNLKIISLNTLLLYKSNNFAVDCNSQESSGRLMLEWLEDILNNAQIQMQSIIIIGHISPTQHYYLPACLEIYNQIANSYNDVIISHQFGHNHLDSFFLIPVNENFINNNNQCAASVVNIVPSVVPSMNPTFRIVEYLQEYPYTYQRYIQYIANLSDANKNGYLTLMEEYSFPNSYNLPDYTISSWCRLLNEIQNNNSIYELNQQFYYLSAGQENIQRLIQFNKQANNNNKKFLNLNLPYFQFSGQGWFPFINQNFNQLQVKLQEMTMIFAIVYYYCLILLNA